MPALITVYRNAKPVASCGTKCYNAKTPNCSCICGGLNHGVGFAKAVQNTTKSAKALARKYLHETHQPCRITAINHPDYTHETQLQMFTHDD